MNRAFRWLWLGQLVSNLGTQCSLYGIGLWSFSQQGQLIDFAAVAVVVQLSKVLVLPLLGRRMGQWPPRRMLLLANGIGALCTIGLAAVLLFEARAQLLILLPLLALAAIAEAAMVLRFASLIPVLVPDPLQLARANGLFAGTDGLILSVAPFIGSWLVASAGMRGVLMVDGLSFIVAMACVLMASTSKLPQPLSEPLTSQARLRLRELLRSRSVRSVVVVGTAMALVYGATEVLFPAWLIEGAGRDRLGLALSLGGGGYLVGTLLWQRWAWRTPSTVLVVGLILQSLILMGAGLVIFQDWLAFWSGGLFVFSLALPMVLAALQHHWQQLVSNEVLPELLAQRYRLEWAGRVVAFVGSAVLVDGVLRPALAWPHWPGWLINSLGQGPGRPLAVGLGAMGWVLLLPLLSQWRNWFREPSSTV